jgi:hypothetical protein
MSSLAEAGDCVGRKPLIREMIPVWVGGGRFKIDLPGIQRLNHLMEIHKGAFLSFRHRSFF